MAFRKIDRTAEDIKRELSVIFRELKDPRISSLLSIVRVEVSGDLSYADVWVSAIEGREITEESVKGLKSAKGYIKKQLASAIQIRKIPDLKFIADDSIAHGADIADIISKFKYKDNEDED